MRFALVVAMAVVAGLGLAAVAPAAQAAGGKGASPALDACEAAFNTCMAECEAVNAESSAGRAGCQARCAANRAGCEAKAGYNQAKPWVQEQFQNLEKFLEGFQNGPKGGQDRAAPNDPPKVGPKGGPDEDAAPGKDI